MNKVILFIITIFCFCATGFAFASITDGTIDLNYKYGWTENAGWLNFGTSEGNVHITDSVLTGYIWGENIGWISLNCSNNNSCGTYNYGVSNDGNGNLSGYAWSENTGWINFNPTYGGVSINSSGEFSGYAWGENIGWIIFDCSGSACVKTDWRPISVRGGNLPMIMAEQRLAQETASIAQENVKPVIEKPIVKEQPKEKEKIAEIPTKIIEQIKQIPEQIAELPGKIVEQIKQIPGRIIEIPHIVKEIFTPKPTEPVKPPEVSIKELTPKEAPLALRGVWQLLPSDQINTFVLSPLPKEIRDLAEKFPELAKTFKEVGITKITDVEKLKTVDLALPALASIKGVPLAGLSIEAKQQVPSDIVFVKNGNEMIDYNIGLTVSDRGQIEQKIITISGKILQLAVKPDNPVKTIKGYIVFNSRKVAKSYEKPLSKLTASMIFAGSNITEMQEKSIESEEKLLLSQFEYVDNDKDGIYTAKIQAPIVDGEYEIITIMDYENIELGQKEIRLITVVDPEGYVFENVKGQELRISGSIVSLFWLNPGTKQYELWPAKEYQQENQQITDSTGKYSFLVPEGDYYIKVETPGYLVYEGKPFSVKEGSGVHFNIELKTKNWWLKVLDWKTFLLIAVGALLLYNFYRDKIRDKGTKSKIQNYKS